MLSFGCGIGFKWQFYQDMLGCGGKADVYPRFAPTMEWDTAAGHAIARAAGMEVYQAEKEEPLQYNKEDLLNPWFIVEPRRN